MTSELPVLGPAANDIPLGLAALDRAREVLSGAEIDRLIAASERLLPFVHEPPGELQPLHGDLHPGNIVGTGDGLVWIDFEDVCLGPPAWDLALLNWMDAGAVAAHHRPDPELLARCSELRALHLAMCLIVFREDLGDLDNWDGHIRDFVGLLRPV